MADLSLPAAFPIASDVADTATAGASAATERERVKQLAQQFESMLVVQMLREMRRSMLEDEQGHGLGADTMTDTFDSELGTVLSKAGGFGLANALAGAIDRQSQGTKPAVVAASSGGAAQVRQVAYVTGAGTAWTPGPMVPATGASVRAVAATTAGASGEQDPVSAAGSDDSNGPPDIVPPSGAVTSAFGWRMDPFTHRVKFHAGADIRAAYGQDVKAAASGTVVTAGEQSGYGMTVVIDHGNGVETRYAHLSGYGVRPGDRVEAGQVVAQSGSSGRSTGPHLHFEVLRDGRPVDPATGLKESAAGADSLAYRSDH